MSCNHDNCHKKISLTDSLICNCKCGKHFCVLHRLAEAHQCAYNFKKEIKKDEFIEKNKCVNNKIQKI